MAELLDVLNENGVVTGRTKTKAEILEAGDWRKVVHIWIVDDKGRLLVQQRAKGRGIFDDMYDVSVGGGVRAAEPTNEAAKREVSEELGLDFPLERFHLLGTWKVQPKMVPGKGVMKDFSDTYLVLVPDVEALLPKLKMQEDEVQWVGVMFIAEMLEKQKDADYYAKWVQHGREYYQEAGTLALEMVRAA